MDNVTLKVKDMYEQYPFPGNLMINVAYGNRIKADMEKRGFPVKNLRILEAGCGTGEKALALAKAFSESQITGWDITSASLVKARELAKREGIRNITFEQVNLVSIDTDKYKDSFDLVVSWGVIHHLSDSVKGLESIGKCLKASGLFYIWVYALHSLQRIETRFVSEAIMLLLKNDEFSYEKGVKIANALKRHLKTLNYGGKRDLLMHLKWFFDKGVNKKQIIMHLLKNFGKIKIGSDFSANIVDAFLHVNVKDYSIEMIFDETERAGLEIVDFLEPSPNIGGFIDNEFVKELYSKLSFKEKLIFMERIANPGNHLFVTKRKLEKPEK